MEELKKYNVLTHLLSTPDGRIVTALRVAENTAASLQEAVIIFVFLLCSWIMKEANGTVLVLSKAFLRMQKQRAGWESPSTPRYSLLERVR